MHATNFDQITLPFISCILVSVEKVTLEGISLACFVDVAVFLILECILDVLTCCKMQIKDTWL